ncbi:hypothetical protein BURMUCGD2M_0346 [Burkholderia multivorans CGD2M]|uniref:Uncharacterized protein n=1 Tax=Burkholderia multivorans CGD2 TaxID=513052 RepID=B9BV67_9BURK|nr:hypothetical protein BURMUCGD2_0350 [Burkholderia multivorans CGD2]EEE10903.1 hypothetical protein BURMUCGD2M_0346 [Burkholderia multivorans CGD2M]
MCFSDAVVSGMVGMGVAGEVDASRVMPLERMRLRRSARGSEP